jgi:predicted TIM-barrel fold metal-dependent hydrolase
VIEMAVDVTTTPQAASRRREGVGLVDCDVHPWPNADQLWTHLSPRWQEYQSTYGLRGPTGRGALLMRPMSTRMDSWPPGGGNPGSDSDFAREQLLDKYDITHALLNPPPGLFPTWTGGNQPLEYSVDMMHALNEWIRTTWLEQDPRWRASISVAYEQPEAAAEEIARCVAVDDRFLQLMLPVRMHRPMGHPSYLPMLDAAVAHGIPVGMHVGGDGLNPITASGHPSYFYEYHTGYGESAFNHIASLIFEGTFDRLPDMKVVLMETNWSWLAPFAWRLDATWSVLKGEVPHLQMKPSEYLARHLWFTSQPAEEFEDARWFADVFGQFQDLGLGDHFMFATDYPHWDFDNPDEAMPDLPQDALERMIWGTASELYGLTL